MDETTAETTHDLLLALAGRVDDDLLAWARELVAVGEGQHAVELVTATLVADGVALPAPVRAAVVAAASSARTELDAAAALPTGGADEGTEHRFDPEPVPDVSDALLALPARLLVSCEVLLTRRLTPAGSAPGPLPHPVVIVEVEPGARPRDVLAYQVAVALERSGVRASVEVITMDGDVPAYHEEALRAAQPVRSGAEDARSDRGAVAAPAPAPAASRWEAPEPVATLTRRTPSSASSFGIRSAIDAPFSDAPYTDTPYTDGPFSDVPPADRTSGDDTFGRGTFGRGTFEEPTREPRSGISPVAPRPLPRPAPGERSPIGRPPQPGPLPTRRPGAAARNVRPLVPAVEAAVEEETTRAVQDPEPAVLERGYPRQYDPLTDTLDDPLTEALDHPPVVPRSEPDRSSDPRPAPAVASGGDDGHWSGEWLSGAWAMSPSDVDEHPANGAGSNGAVPEPVPDRPVAQPLPVRRRSARHRFHTETFERITDPTGPEHGSDRGAATAPDGPAERPEAGAEPSLDELGLRADSVARLSTADRELLTRLQTELQQGRRPGTGPRPEADPGNRTGGSGAGANGAGANGAGSNGTGSNGAASYETGADGTGADGTGGNGTDPHTRRDPPDLAG